MFSVITLAVELVIKAFLNELTLGSGKTEAIDIAFIALFSLAFMYDIGRSKKLKQLSVPLFTGYIWRLLLLFWDIYGRDYYFLPNSGADSEMFYHTSCIYSVSGYVEGSRGGLFSKVMSIIFRYIGTSRLYGQFIIVLFSVVSLVLFALLLKKIDIPDKTRYYICLIVVLLPNLAILSSIFLRESITAMFITISFYLFYKWLNGKNIIYFVIAFISAFCASAFHSGSAAVAVGYVGIILLYDRQSKTFRFKMKNLIPTIVLLIILSYLYVNYADSLFGKMSNVETISDVADDEIRGNSSYARYVGNSNNLFNMVIYTPLRLLFFIGSPFPWQWRGLSDIIAFCFSSLFYMYTILCDIRFLRSGEKKNRTLVIALSIIAFSALFVFGWGVANTGTAIRHRDKMTIIWGLLLALTYRPKKHRLASSREVSTT